MYIGLEQTYRATLCIGNLKFGEIEFGEMKRNTSNWFCMLSRHAGLSASVRLSCFLSGQLVPRRRRGGRVLDRQCVAWASGGVGAERRAACDAACESLGTSM